MTKFVARNRALVAGGVALTLLLAAFSATASVQARRIARERDHAEHERRAADDVVAILTGLFERADPNKHAGGDTLRVASLLDDAEEEVERLTDDSTRQIALWRTVGRMRAAHGEFARAIELLTKAYDRRRALFGATDVEAARIHHEIALVAVAYRGETVARAMLDSSLTELRTLLGDEHEEVRSAMSDLMGATSDSVAARALLERVLTLERKAPSRDPIAIASRFDAQGSARYELGRYEQAAALFEASLGLLERHLPPTHENIRTERRNLALALQGQGKLARAESLQRIDLEMEERINGPAVARASAREALAITLGQAGHADSAEHYERTALALFREGTARGHWRVWSAARNLAFIVAARGRAEEGLTLLDSAIAIARAGPDSGESAAYLTAQRVPFLLRLDRLAEASRSIELAEQRLGAAPSVSASHRADVHRYAGTIELASGATTRAVQRFRKAVALDELSGQPGIHSCLLGVGLAQLRELEEARTLLREPCSSYEAQGLTDPLILRWIAAARRRVGGQAATR